MVKQRTLKKRPFWSKGRLLILALLIVVIGIACAGVYWRRIYSDPQRTFQDMLSLNLETGSVTRHVAQASEEGTLDQTTTLSLGTQNTAHTLTTLTQPGQSSNDKVVTESIGTLEADYLRYREITTPQMSANGKPINFSNVLNVWAKGESSSLGGQSAAQLFNESVVGIVPFAKLNSETRKHLLNTIRDKDVYNTDYAKAVYKLEHGRPVYTYTVNVKPAAYIAMLKEFGHDLGLKQLDNVEPAAYAQRPAQQLEFKVDVLSRQLLSINYHGANRQETYSGYGLQKIVDIPSSTIPITELQNRLQQIQ